MTPTQLIKLCGYLAQFDIELYCIDSKLIIPDYHNILNINIMWNLSCEWTPSVRGYTFNEIGETPAYNGTGSDYLDCVLGIGGFTSYGPIEGVKGLTE